MSEDTGCTQGRHYPSSSSSIPDSGGGGGGGRVLQGRGCGRGWGELVVVKVVEEVGAVVGGGEGGGRGSLPGGVAGGEGTLRRRPLWKTLRWSGTRSLEDGRRASDVGWSSSGSFGNAFDASSGGGSGGGGDGSGSRVTAPGKIPDLLRVAFFDPDHGTSRQHLVKLFNSLDTNKSGTITYEAMRMGLANLGTYSDLNYLMRKVEMDKTKQISLDDFIQIVQDYAEKMCVAKRELPVSCFCYDYSPEDVAFRWVNTGDPNPPSPSVSLRDLMSERRDAADVPTERGRIPLPTVSPAAVVVGVVVVMVVVVVMMAVVVVVVMATTAAVEVAVAAMVVVLVVGRLRVLLMGSPTGVLRRLGGLLEAVMWMTVVAGGVGVVVGGAVRVGVLLVGVGMVGLRMGVSSVVVGVGLLTWGSGMLMVRVEVGVVVLAVVTVVVAVLAAVMEMKVGVGVVLMVLIGVAAATVGVVVLAGVVMLLVSIFLVGDHTVLYIEPTPSGVSDQISNRIYYAGSKLRLNNARYLVYSLMDSIVDDVFPIMQHFQVWLVQLQEQLHSVQNGPSLDIVRAIQQISRDMHMITFYLRPMKMVATQLIADLPGNDADLRRHLEDLRDHLLMLEEKALRMSTWSRSLNKDWVNEQQHRMNQVVYILTMVTSAFMPAQFLTGVFGECGRVWELGEDKRGGGAEDKRGGGAFVNGGGGKIGKRVKWGWGRVGGERVRGGGERGR
eukprot:jgi/Undpi1/12934/HiC_scaffold_7.g02600.m1